MRINEVLFFYYDENSGGTAVVYKNQKDPVMVDEKPEILLENWCLRNGSTLEGRINAVQKSMGYIQKTPVLVSERSGLMFFPTRGHENSDAIWINPHWILVMKEEPDAATEVTFLDGRTEHFAIDRRTLIAQNFRCHEIMNNLFDTGWYTEETMEEAVC